MEKPFVNELVLTDYVQLLVRYKARQLTDRWDFKDCDPEDLQQELWLALVRAASQFDPAKASLDTFLDRVVNTAVRMMLRARNRGKRGNALSTKSLDRELAQHSDTAESLSTAIDAADLARRTGGAARDEAAFRESAEALDHALTQMPSDLRQVCEGLKTGGIASVARQLGVSRRQIRRLAGAARPLLEQAGLGF